MSPFSIIPVKRVSCLAEGPAHLDAHARECTCICPPCLQMQHAHARVEGSITRDSDVEYSFVYALGNLHVVPGLDTSIRLLRLYSEFYKERGVREPIPQATIGWLVAVASGLRIVAAPSDPWKAAAAHALRDWAAREGLDIVAEGDALPQAALTARLTPKI